MAEMRIIVTGENDRWDAWFEDRPEQTFSGLSPAGAVEHLWSAELRDRKMKRIAAMLKLRPQTDRWRRSGF